MELWIFIKAFMTVFCIDALRVTQNNLSKRLDWQVFNLREKGFTQQIPGKTMEHDYECENSRGWVGFPCECEERLNDKLQS